MPPWSGTPEEAELLTAYLSSIAPHAARRNAAAERSREERRPD